MLTTETVVIDDAIAELGDRIDDLADDRETRNPASDEYAAIKDREDRLSYLRDGLRWQRDEEGWGGDATVTLGALTAGEEAIMHRAMSANPNRNERRLWFVAAATVDAPYGASRDPDEEPLTESTIEETFAALAGQGIHSGFVKWAESKANALATPGGPGNGDRSAESSQATTASATSTTGPDSTTTSSSDSRTD